MKKFAIALVSVLAVAIMCCSLAACGASGTYKFYSTEILGQEYKVGDTIPGTNQKLESGSYRLVLKGDGSCTFKSTESEEEVTGTWEEGENGKITFNGVGLTNATRDGNTIVFNFGVAKVTLKK